jgi:spectinomycin phosphotransferase
LAFLPIGADKNTAVYRAITDNETSYFVKLRSGVFDEMSIIVPKLLHDQGITHIIAPLSTRSKKLWISLSHFKLAVFPFIEGYNGYEGDVSEYHWVVFGRVLKAIHSAKMPSTVMNRLQKEHYSDEWRERVKNFQRLAIETHFANSLAFELATFLRHKQAEISEIIRRAEYLASVLQAQSHSFILCHADIHAGNILIDTNNHLYIVDWDTLILAPKERDLMYVGGGQFVNKRSPQEEETLFYRGYGQTQTDPVALAYYRYERIVQDIAAYCVQILLTDEGGEDREIGLHQLMNQFQPNNVLEIAYRSEKALPQEHKSE